MNSRYWPELLGRLVVYPNRYMRKMDWNPSRSSLHGDT
jgi:hypothetical protein